jgi:hypothetical protein
VHTPKEEQEGVIWVTEALQQRVLGQEGVFCFSDDFWIQPLYLRHQQLHHLSSSALSPHVVVVDVDNDVADDASSVLQHFDALVYPRWRHMMASTHHEISLHCQICYNYSPALVGAITLVLVFAQRQPYLHQE